MPQFELDAVGPNRFSGRTRGRSPEEAVRRAVGVVDEATVAVADDEDFHGWRVVTIGGESSGRLRLHQRMQFRRD